MGIGDESDVEFSLAAFEKVAHHRGFPTAHLTRDEGKAQFPGDHVFQQSQSMLVSLR
jgi:hypothetical protein